jgi:hypothetical protein
MQQWQKGRALLLILGRDLVEFFDVVCGKNMNSLFMSFPNVFIGNLIKNDRVS